MSPISGHDSDYYDFFVVCLSDSRLEVVSWSVVTIVNIVTLLPTAVLWCLDVTPSGSLIPRPKGRTQGRGLHQACALVSLFSANVSSGDGWSQNLSPPVQRFEEASGICSRKFFLVLLSCWFLVSADLLWGHCVCWSSHA